MFGWHVHEKASLHFVIPFAIISLKSVEDAKHYFYLSVGNSLLTHLLVVIDRRPEFISQHDLCDKVLPSQFAENPYLYLCV